MAEKIYTRDTAFSEIKDPAIIGQKLDAELDVLGNKLEEILGVVKKVVNDDGSLKPVVNAKALSSEISLGIGEVTEWAPGKLYLPNQMVFVEYAVLWCLTKHTSASNFQDNVNHWRVVINFAPYIDKVSKLANASHVMRVAANLDMLLKLSEQTSKLVELSSHIDKLLELTRRLPDLDKFLSDDGNVVLQDVYKALPAIRTINASEQDVFNVSRSRTQIAELAKITPEIKKLAGAFDDIRLAAKSIRNLKAIAGEMEKLGDG